jgi:GNAT superfamily N-acetyltransferase
MTVDSEAVIRVERCDILSATARGLIAALNAELVRSHPEESGSPFHLPPEDVAEGRGAFLVALRGAEPMGCGALRRVDSTTGELKRMYVRPEARGLGVGRALLAALQDEARRLGLTRVALETTRRQQRALAVYARNGFVRIEPFGDYGGLPESVCMAKDL